MATRAAVALAGVTVIVLAALLVVARGTMGGAALVERASPVVEGASGSKGAAGGDEGAGEAGESPGEEGEAPEPVVVHVDGAVVAPGVYVLAEGSRVNDAVLAAGGLSEGADTSALNLASVLADGEKVHVPVAGEAPVASSGGSDTEGPKVVNINTAGVEELDELPGVGEATAEAIVEERERNGPFTSVEDIMRVSGIGEKKFEKLVGRICV